MSNERIKKYTGDYETWLLSSLHDKEEAAIFLSVAFEEFQKDGDIEALLLAIRHVSEAQGGIGKLAKKTNLNRESLYKTLSSKGNPKLFTIGLLLKALGFQLFVKHT